MNELTMPDKIERLKAATRHLDQIEIPTQHFLLEGMYVRQTFIKAGTVFIGRTHKKPHFFMCLKGRAEVTVGEEILQITAGMTLMCTPGTRRAGFTIEDTVFAGVFRTDQKDLEDIEAELTEYDPTARYGVSNEILPLELICDV